MTPEQAAAIARRIGMLGSSAGHGQWFEATGLAVCTTPSLPHYLSTGDRPLRVMEAYVLTIQPVCVEGAWVWDAITSGVTSQWFSLDDFQPTPAAAILACAAQIEGEGHE
jgi:hypothetical protein